MCKCRPKRTSVLLRSFELGSYDSGDQQEVCSAQWSWECSIEDCRINLAAYQVAILTPGHIVAANSNKINSTVPKLSRHEQRRSLCAVPPMGEYDRQRGCFLDRPPDHGLVPGPHACHGQPRQHHQWYLNAEHRSNILTLKATQLSWFVLCIMYVASARSQML